MDVAGTILVIALIMQQCKQKVGAAVTGTKITSRGGTHRWAYSVRLKLAPLGPAIEIIASIH